MLILKNPNHSANHSGNTRIQKSLRNLWADGSWDPSLPEVVSPVDLNLHKKRNLKTEPRKTRAFSHLNPPHLRGAPPSPFLSRPGPQDFDWEGLIVNCLIMRDLLRTS